MTQLGLDYIPPAPPPEPTLAERFARFHAEHPEVYRELVRLAREWKAAGNSRCGIKALWERLRWEMGMRKDKGEEFKCNNSWTAFYARILMEQEPDLRGLFETRERKHGR